MSSIRYDHHPSFLFPELHPDLGPWQGEGVLADSPSPESPR